MEIRSGEKANAEQNVNQLSLSQIRVITELEINRYRTRAPSCSLELLQVLLLQLTQWHDGLLRRTLR